MTPWTRARQALLSSTASRGLVKLLGYYPAIIWEWYLSHPLRPREHPVRVAALLLVPYAAAPILNKSARLQSLLGGTLAALYCTEC